MKHGWRRVVAAGALLTFVAALVATPSHASGAQGVGSAGGSTALVGIDAGDLLKLQVIGEQSSASIDPANGTPSATETVSPLQVLSAMLPALDSLSAPSVSTTSTGAADSKSTDAIDLASVPQPAPLLSGQIAPASLSSLVDADGAHASLTSSLANVAVAGGVAKVDSASVDLGGVAGPNASTSSRSVTVNGVTVLDLRALLQMVGLDLNKLPLSILSDLIQQLGLFDTLNSLTGLNLQSPSDITGLVDSLNQQLGTIPTQISGLQDQVTTLQGQLATAQTQLATLQSQLDAVNAQLAPLQSQLTTLQGQATSLQSQITAIGAATCALPPPLDLGCAALQTQLASVNSQITSVTGQINTLTSQATNLSAQISTLNSTISSLNAQIAALLAQIAALTAPLQSIFDQLSNVLGGLADTLDLQPLLRLEGIEVGSTATAADTVGNSVATTTGKIGNVKIGGINLGGLDVGATLDQVNALAASATQAVDNVLGTISPQLANLVHIELFKHATDVSQNGAYVDAVAGITGLLATVTPPDVCAVLNDVLTQLPTGLNSLPGVTLPSLPVSDVLSTIGSTVNCSVPGILRAQAIVPALTAPITVAAAQANSVASFAAAQQSTTTTTTTTTTSTTSTTTSTGSPSNTSNPSTTSTPLARTGAENALYLLAGAMLLTVAYATRRTMVAVRADSRRKV